MAVIDSAVYRIIMSRMELKDPPMAIIVSGMRTRGRSPRVRGLAV